ncbi:SRPBCC family protein [Streptomyces palmae]|uniref:SRPBCC family protein n=1 Tax=Streptomyces palmae TaxID=1701085 RepID=A0A4Z0HIE4_9ACTN|nr:SRPBCC family protein [Streptomyces palmae]TGB18960.1 SRPBCC family protein [Streptomyces palmae]
MPQTVSETMEIAVPPQLVYDTVTNVAEMGRWSPECTGATVHEAGRAACVGMRFTGRNASHLKKRPWSTNCTVVAAEPGRLFAFSVTAIGLPISIWSYRFEPLDGGAATRVTETWTDTRGKAMLFIGPKVSGIHDRVTHNRQGMQVTLRRLKEALETAHRSG